MNTHPQPRLDKQTWIEESRKPNPPQREEGLFLWLSHRPSPPLRIGRALHRRGRKQKG